MDVAGRFRIEAELARGGMGTVYRATDRVSGRSVAVKRPRSGDASLRDLALREVMALRLLDLPGVVQLVESGEDEAGAWMVTELVDGAHFPGAGPRHAARLSRLATRLLEILARVHAVGVVHRDLKPGNVLVDAQDGVHVLDFGVACGDAMPATPSSGGLTGTPRYAAPEQVAGDPVDARADLYAVGLMLHEAIGGQLPFAEAPLITRVRRDAPAIRESVPTLDPRLAQLVDRLLRRDPADRPASAVAALALLGGAAPAPLLRWAGPTTAIDALVAAARAGLALDLVGAPGLGRSRALEEAAARLAAEGFEILRLAPSTRPLGSIRSSFDLPDELDPEACLARIRARLAEGVVLVVDPPDRVDRWSLRLLGGIGAQGAVLGFGGPALALDPLAEADLRALFAGPDLLLHLRTDGAAELHRRSGGRPAQVARVVSDWVAAGLCEVRGGLIHLAPGGATALQDAPVRGGLAPGHWPGGAEAHPLLPWVVLADGALGHAGLGAATGRPAWEVAMMVEELADLGLVGVEGERILASPGAEAALAEWTEADRRDAHAALAAVVPSPSRARLRHLVQAGDARAALREGLAVATEAVAGGRMLLAARLLATVWGVTRGLVDPQEEVELLTAFVEAAYGAEDAGLQRAAADATRRSPPVAMLALDLYDVAHGLALLRDGELGRAEAVLAALGPQADERVERLRVGGLVEVRARVNPDGALAETEAWADWAAADQERQGRWQGWRGLALYRAGRFAEAAAAHAVAAALRGTRAGRLTARMNALVARLEVGDWDDAAVGAVLAEAEELRLPAVELRVRALLRGERYRRGEAFGVDETLVEAARVLGIPAVAPVILQEAAIAWRAGDARAVPLARLARELLRGPSFVAVNLDAFLAMLGEPVPGLVERIRALPPSRARSQAVALARRAGLALAPEPWPAEGDPERRWELLSAVEVAG